MPKDERNGPFHDGEITVQERAGVRAGATKIGRSIDDEIAPAAAHFLAQRYTLYLGTLDGAGRPWASQLFGPPGFVGAVDGRTVRIDATPAPGDPVLENLRADPHVGLLAIDLATRRRFRVNGTATVGTDGTILVSVAQAYGNCPKYIQRREPVEVRPAPADPTRVARHRSLTATARAQIARADTFFLATANPADGADVSHRGGRPGFVEVASDTRLVWPDYQGNMMFMSLGNVAVHPFAGLLFVDFETGDVLQLTGRAAIDWDAAHAATVPGAERLVTFDVDELIAAPAASPLRWRLVEASPTNP
jgi:predicted pyridoxine 5'-phosphate oxidase superfamily flavin-nucleotide-binding protein